MAPASLAWGKRLWTALGAWLLLSPTAYADSVAELGWPEPLTLEYVLSLADRPHPALHQADAERRLAQAQLANSKSITGINTTLEGRVRLVEPPSDAFRDSRDDHGIRLRVSKRLFDFGRSRAAVAAATAALRGSEWSYLAVGQQRRVEILEGFFAVLLADLTYARDNEAMATAFVELDRTRDRNELGQVSDVALLRLESTYQEARRKRYASQLQQRAARSRLANLLNRPGDLPATLAMPELYYGDLDVGDVEDLTRAALQDNPVLQALRAQVHGARKSIEAARAERYGVVTGGLEVAEYSRDFGSREPAMAEITFELPLTTGGRIEAQIAESRAELQRLEATLAAQALEVRQAVLDLWLELERLRVRAEELDVLGDFRDLALDRSRALYELEVTADLGDAMVQSSDLKLQRAEHGFNTALAWARLDALLGKAVMASAGDE